MVGGGVGVAAARCEWVDDDWPVDILVFTVKPQNKRQIRIMKEAKLKVLQCLTSSGFYPRFYLMLSVLYSSQSLCTSANRIHLCIAVVRCRLRRLRKYVFQDFLASARGTTYPIHACLNMVSSDFFRVCHKMDRQCPTLLLPGYRRRSDRTSIGACGRPDGQARTI